MVLAFNLGFEDATRTEAALQAHLREEMRRADPEMAKAFIEAEHQVQEEKEKLEAIKDENNSCESQDQDEDQIDSKTEEPIGRS